MKENLKPYVYKLWKHHVYRCNRVLFVERSGELRCLARLSTKKVRSRRETKSEEGAESVQADPKPGDLSMSRLKLP